LEPGRQPGLASVKETGPIVIWMQERGRYFFDGPRRCAAPRSARPGAPRTLYCRVLPGPNGEDMGYSLTRAADHLIHAHRAPTSAVAFSPMANVSWRRIGNGTVKVIDVASGQEALSVPIQQQPQMRAPLRQLGVPTKEIRRTHAIRTISLTGDADTGRRLLPLLQCGTRFAHWIGARTARSFRRRISTGRVRTVRCRHRPGKSRLRVWP